MSGNLLHRQSSSHLLGRSSSGDSFHELKNNFEEHLKECLRSDLLKIMINIYGRNTAGAHSPSGNFWDTHCTTIFICTLLSYIDNKSWFSSFTVLSGGFFPGVIFLVDIFPGVIFLTVLFSGGFFLGVHISENQGTHRYMKVLSGAGFFRAGEAFEITTLR